MMKFVPGKHLLVEIAPNLVDSDHTGMTLLLTDLQVALEYLDKKEAQLNAVSFQIVQGHARHTYDEILSLLPRLMLSDDNRRHLDAQIAVLKMRLLQLGEALPTS
jgi:hypothetical protein